MIEVAARVARDVTFESQISASVGLHVWYKCVRQSLPLHLHMSRRVKREARITDAERVALANTVD